MKTSSTTVFLCTMAFTGAVVLGGSLEGCRSDTNGSNGAGASPATTASNSSTTGTASAAGGAGGSGPAELVTIQQIVDPTANGHVGANTPVKLVGAVAMSTKFLVSKSSSNSCLWGVFLSAPGLTETAANTGVLAVGYGTPATASDGGTAFCPTIQAGQPAGDAFPDDIKPGDVVDVVGETDSYIPKTCSAADAGPGASDVAGLQLSKVTSATRTMMGGPVPTPHMLTTADLTSLASGTDQTWITSWGNVRVEADNVSVMAYQGALADTYGHMYLTDGIQIGDKLYYVGYVKKTDACYSGPQFPTISPTFNFVRGFVYLDYCNWGIAPQDKCHDLSPASDDCLSMFDAGMPDPGDGGAEDAGGPNPGTVCLH